MHWQEFLALLTLATATRFTPGPDTTLSTALAANFGLRRAMRFVLAVPLLRIAIRFFGIGWLHPDHGATLTGFPGAGHTPRAMARLPSKTSQLCAP